MGYIEGVDRQQMALFPEAVEDYISGSNPVRVIDEYVEGLAMEELGFERAVPAEEGRPGYDPRGTLKLYLYGYLNGIRSSRKLERETHRNVEVIWLMRQLKPDHKTIAEFRRKHTKALKRLMREFVKMCRELELLTEALVFIDGSKFQAVNARERNYTENRVERLLKLTQESIERYLRDLAWEDQKERRLGGALDPELPAKLEKLRARQKELQGIRQQIRETGEQVSETDPESRRMKVRGAYEVSYNAQIAVDPKHHLIVAQEVTNEVTDEHQLAPMAIEAKEALGVEKLAAGADAGYDNGEQVVLCEAAGIEPYVPEGETARKEEKGFSKKRFVYDEERDAYRCPAGEWLERRTESRDKKGRLLGYYQNFPACQACAFRARCTTGQQGRRIMRPPEEARVLAMRQRLRERPELMKQRKAVVEHVFGTIKREGNGGYFLTKGKEGVNGEFSLAALAYNLRRVINVLGAECLLERLLRRRLGPEPA